MKSRYAPLEYLRSRFRPGYSVDAGTHSEQQAHVPENAARFSQGGWTIGTLAWILFGGLAGLVAGLGAVVLLLILRLVRGRGC